MSVHKKTDTMNDAEKVLKGLLEGSERFRKAEAPAERERLAKGQSPKAAVLYCSDSREVVETLLGCEKRGEIFGVRLPGNVASSKVLGSLAFGVEHFHIPLIIVLGHTKCGAIAAAKSGAVAEDEDLQGLVSLVALDEKENVRVQVQRILQNRTVARLVAEGKVKVVGALHDMEKGTVKVLG